jgi:hypothetical protein
MLYIPLKGLPLKSVRSALLLLVPLLLTAEALDPHAYWSAPSGTYESRRAAYASWSAASGNHGLYVQVARMAEGKPVEEAPIREAIRFVNNREDTADFRVAALLRIYAMAKPEVISIPLTKEIRKTLLDFKYWCDEPGGDSLMGTWSENHQMLFHSSEYLAGQMFPDEIFTNNGKSGKWHMQHALHPVLSWINTKAKAGFSEWDSNAYFPEDIATLLNLADYARDPEVSRRAANLLSVMFFDIAVDSFQGTFGTSHGRTYQGTVQSGRAEGTSPVEWIAFGMGSLGSPDNVASVFLSISPKYRVPAIIQKIAADAPAELINRERQGLTIAAAKEIGLRFDDPNDIFLMWDSGRLSNRADAERSLRMLNQFNFHRYEVVIKPYAEAVLGTYKALEEMGVAAEGLDRTTLEQVNKITYRTPDYELSTAQDYRKGKAGYQQHIWQATLGPESIVFTLNPSVSTKYWVGQYPKSVQYKNLLIALYNIPSQTPPGPKTVVPPDAGGNAMPSPGPSEELPAGFTEAIFHKSGYDELIEKNGWHFGHKGNAFIALHSQQPVRWSEKEVLGGQGMIADGRKNVWICQMGRLAVDGPFKAWTDRIAAAPLTVDGLSVHYQAPGIGDARISWDDALTIDGVPVTTTGYDRFDNPYCRAPWGRGRYEIRFREDLLILDFANH